MEGKKKKGISIRTKLIGVIVPIVIFIIAAFFILAENMVLDISKRELEAKSQSNAGYISAWTSQIFGELEVYKQTIEEGGFADDEAILKYMETSVDKNEAYPIGLYMGDNKGVYLDASGWVPGSDWILTERDWYVDGKDNDNLAFGEPYYDSQSGDMCVSATVRVDYKPAVRVLAADIYLDYVTALVSDIAASGEVEAFLVTKDTQTVIAHPDTEMMAVTLSKEGIDSLYQEVGNALVNNREGVVDIKGDAGKYFACINSVDNTDWYLVTYITQSKMLSDLHWMEMYMLMIALVAAVVLIIVVLRIVNRIVKPVAKVTDVIDKIAEGDFTPNLEVKGNDEIARMGKNMQHFLVQMRSTISEISDTAEWLNKQSVENDNASESLLASSDNQAQSMVVLNEMVDRLFVAAGQVSTQMEQLAELIHKTHKEGTAADVLMKESVVMSGHGKDDMTQINEGMSDIGKSITMLSEQIGRVGETTAQIGDMVSIIMDIAEETNLLSLNASIEAARAGEAGRGFAVVAEQISKLATSSSEAADNIAKLTNEIKATVNEAVTHMNVSVDEVQTNIDIVAKATTTFEDLYAKVDETSARVAQMIELVTKVDVVSSQMEQITVNQVDATEHIVQSAKELDEHTKNVASNSSTIAESAETLQKEAVELAERMNKFKV